MQGYTYDAVLAPSLTTVVSVLKIAPPDEVTLLNTQVKSVAKCTALFCTNQLCRNRPPPSYLNECDDVINISHVSISWIA